ncbi:hypothetical protein HaLaN_01291 [Haematococcus lacustris]|uniref:Uncharacterized protein n=1 Tax=Haematococcus lacustris TaxID=44745 RepID=A0A699YFK2_HAELA|nr:hypothetical protein HaLaN_01291 [Haematococcus lacustris]
MAAAKGGSSWQDTALEDLLIGDAVECLVPVGQGRVDAQGGRHNTAYQLDVCRVYYYVRVGDLVLLREPLTGQLYTAVITHTASVERYGNLNPLLTKQGILVLEGAVVPCGTFTHNTLMYSAFEAVFLQHMAATGQATNTLMPDAHIRAGARATPRNMSLLWGRPEQVPWLRLLLANGCTQLGMRLGDAPQLSSMVALSQAVAGQQGPLDLGRLRYLLGGLHAAAGYQPGQGYTGLSSSSQPFSLLDVIAAVVASGKVEGTAPGVAEM